MPPPWARYSAIAPESRRRVVTMESRWRSPVTENSLCVGGSSETPADGLTVLVLGKASTSPGDLSRHRRDGFRLGSAATPAVADCGRAGECGTGLPRVFAGPLVVLTVVRRGRASCFVAKRVRGQRAATGTAIACAIVGDRAGIIIAPERSASGRARVVRVRQTRRRRGTEPFQAQADEQQRRDRGDPGKVPFPKRHRLMLRSDPELPGCHRARDLIDRPRAIIRRSAHLDSWKRCSGSLASMRRKNGRDFFGNVGIDWRGSGTSSAWCCNSFCSTVPSGKRRPGREHVVERAAQGINVAADVGHARVAGLLGRYIVERSERHAAGREIVVRPCGRADAPSPYRPASPALRR